LTAIAPLGHAAWAGPSPEADADGPATLLERGDVVFLPHLAFDIENADTSLFSPAILSSAKNASFDPAASRVGGTTLAGADRDRLRQMMSRFSDRAAALVNALLPRYRGRIRRARASFRPAEIAGRASSWRKDDTRLHVDSFPATPVQGARILRLFTNVNPQGRPRTWRVGAGFEEVAARFAPRLSMPWRLTGHVLRALRVTKSRRTPYDALMLQLHDLMKRDASFQAASPQTVFNFPPGSTWIAFTDHVSHAAMAGQYQLEQTFLLPVDAMLDESRSPLRILERLTGRRLA
jgi:hypothetical protein